MPELLAPAGNMEKLKTAILYGANAVYFAGQAFGMRASADNFTDDELCEAVKYAHAHKAKAYITINTMPHEGEYSILANYLKNAIKKASPDALIVADIGVIELVKELLPEMEIHLSTQANAVSSAACRAWHRLGVKRVVLARELSLFEIVSIRKCIPPELELEAFIHGSMCISYSGRCLLSGYLTGRDANRGACTQPCRWQYKISEGNFELREEKRPNIPLPISENNGDTFIMSSKDTCMIEYIPELFAAGIDSFKIEGRMKSAYYTAVTTNTYRIAMDAFERGNYAYDPAWLKELESVSHREYATGYYFSDPHLNANTADTTGYLREKAYLATVVSYNEERQEALCVQKNKFSVGEEIEILTPGKIGTRCKIRELYDIDHNPIEAVPHPQMNFYLKTEHPLLAGDILRSASE